MFRCPDTVSWYKVCMQKHQQKSSKWDKSHFCGTPLSRPAISLSTTNGHASGYGESVHPDFQSRRQVLDSSDDRDPQDNCVAFMSSEESAQDDIRKTDFLATDTPSRECHTAASFAANTGVHDKLDNAEIVNSGHMAEVNYDAQSFDIAQDALIWAPPEPDELHTDVEYGVDVDDDDDDEYTGGTNWGLSSCPSNRDVESGTKIRSNDELKRAVTEVMNNHFQTIISQLLRLSGLSHNWLDVVSSLSWDAAKHIKPECNKGTGMDPTSYLKVKCIAAGSCNQSYMVRGLVYKKNAAHKRMTTRYSRPRLLLLQGDHGHCASGLSSFDSMKEEQEQFSSLKKMIELCQPNVILVEKTVSRDLKDYLLAKGITLIFDLNLSHIERIARCTGSAIISSAASLTISQLQQCDSFHIDKFVEEHNCPRKGEKRKSKTLTFFEGFPKPLDCTILLHGAHTGELKKVKSVLRQAVFLAYHLNLETSFLVDQGAVISEKYVLDLINPFTNINYASVVHKSGQSHVLNYSGITNTSSCPEKFCHGAEYHTTPKEKLCADNASTVVNVFGNNETYVSNDDKEIPDLQILVGDRIILTLHSLHCPSKGFAKKQHQLCRIKFYAHFDMSVGRFLHDFVFNQKHCGRPAKDHIYSYLHQNGKLTIHIRELSPGLSLPYKEEKIWMWRLCLKCRQDKESAKSQPRVVMSDAACGLSFGKLLELSFSDHLAASRFSACGHCIHRDCLQFYGLGATVAMFVYSSVDIYSAYNPPSVLDVSNTEGHEWLNKDAQNLLGRGCTLFQAVMNSLQEIDTRFSSPCTQKTLKLTNYIKCLDKANASLEQEKCDFEEALMENGQIGQMMQRILNVNHLNHELQLLLYVWDQRLQCLVSSAATADSSHEEKLHLWADEVFSNIYRKRKGVNLEYDADLSENAVLNGGLILRSDVLGNVRQCRSGQAQVICPVDENVCKYTDGHFLLAGTVNHCVTDNDRFDQDGNIDVLLKDVDVSEAGLSDQPEVLTTVWGIPKSVDHSGTAADGGLKFEVNNSSRMGEVPDSLFSEVQNSEHWVWAPFSEICRAYRKDLQRGNSQQFSFINSFHPVHLSAVSPVIMEEKYHVHFAVGINDDIMYVYEDEFTSIITCALVSLLHWGGSSGKILGMENRVENAANHMKTSREYLDTCSATASSYGLPRDPSEELTGLHGLSDVDHPEISLGPQNLPGKCKYTVVCLYAKQFYSLRSKCCPSEFFYISSLSRCKKWDPRGGKSKAFFARTLDERFIIKEVKRTELDSFVRFAPGYFKHISHCLTTESQTCLAKILGIYQVSIRETRTGKDVSIALMVMENLLFGRNISCLYDLKGALHSRYTSKADDQRHVLLDQNFLEDMCISPIYISIQAKQLLERAIWNDTCFLTSINVMDYSLLVGVDKQRKELVYGVIDYLRQYTWDKHLETWVKSSLVVPKDSSPTVISPKEYKKRFRKFVSNNFLTLPYLHQEEFLDSW